MKLVRKKSITFRVFILLVLALGASALPVSLISLDAYSKYKQTQTEYYGSKLLGAIASVAHIACLDASEKTDDAELESIAKSIENYSNLIAETSDSYRRNSRGKLLLSKDTIMSLCTAKDRNSLINEICSYVALMSEMYSDGFIETHVLTEACADIMPRIYAGYFEMDRILGRWAQSNKNTAELSYVSANLRDDSRDLVNTLKRVSVNSNYSNYSRMFGGLNQFNVSAEELDSLVAALWKDEPLDVSRIKYSLGISERISAEIWSASSQVLGDLLELRMLNIKNDMIMYGSIYCGSVLLCFLVWIFFIWVMSRSFKNTENVLKLSIGGLLSEASEMCEGNSIGCSDEISRIDESLNALLKNFSRTLNDVRALASASDNIEIASDSFSKRQKPHYESMEAAILQLQSNNSTESSRFEALEGRISEFRANVVRVADELIAQSNDVSSKVLQVVAERDYAKSYSDNIRDAQNAVEKLDGIAQNYSDIAERANLLAMNLSMETERAGLKGTGIAALAEEIRALSVRTSVSVLDIEAVKSSIDTLFGAGLDNAEKFIEASEARRMFSEGLRANLKSLAERLVKIVAISEKEKSDSAREDITFALVSLRKNMEGLNSILAEFSQSVKTSISEFARVVGAMSNYK